MNKKIAILVKNHTHKLRDVGDINGYTLFDYLKSNKKVDATLIYLHKTSKAKSEGTSSIWSAFIQKYDAIYASSPKRYFFIICIIFSVLHMKTLHISIFDSSLEPITNPIGKLILQIVTKLKIINLYSVSRYQKRLVKKRVGISTQILYPCLKVFGYNKIYKKSLHPSILFAGSTNNEKRGLDNLLEACEIVAKKYPKLELIILNKFEIKDRRNIVNQDKSKCKYKITNKGFVTNIEIYYKKAWVYVLPFESIKYTPPLPFTFLEALSFKTPVISTIYPQYNELAKVVLLVKINNEVDLAKNIIRIFNSKDRPSIGREYFPENVAKQFLTLIT